MNDTTIQARVAVLLSLRNDGELSFKRDVLGLSLLWGLGFALTFVTKWALATLVLGQNIFADAYGVSMYRMEAGEFSRWEAVTMNFDMLNPWVFGLVAVVFLVVRLLAITVTCLLFLLC